MTTKYILIDGINPVPWQSPEFTVGRAKGGKLFGKASSPPNMKAFKAAVREEIASIGDDLEPFPKRTTLYVFFYYWRGLDQYSTPTGKNQTAHRADVTNLNKNLEDALQRDPKHPTERFLYENDVDNRSVMGFMVEQGVEVEPLLFIAATDELHMVKQLADLDFVTAVVNGLEADSKKAWTIK